MVSVLKKSSQMDRLPPRPTPALTGRCKEVKETGVKYSQFGVDLNTPSISALLDNKRSGYSKPADVIPIISIDPVAICRAETSWNVEPGTAAQNAF